MGLKIVLDTKDAVRAADAFAKAIDRVQKAVGVAGQSADRFQKLTNNMARRFGAVDKAAAKAGTSVEKFARAVATVPAPVDRASASMGRMGRAAATSGGQLQSLVRQFLGFQAARKAVTTIAELESGLVTLGTVTGRTGADLDELKDTAIDVARETRFTPEETIGALLSLSRAGQDAAQAAKSLISVTQLAQAGVTSLGQAADLTAATIAQFQSQTVDAAQAASTLVATADRTKSTVLSLGASLAQAGQAAATFGVSLSETAALAGVLQDSGVQASRAGRAIKTILAQLASAGQRSESSRESLRLLGLEIGDVIPGQGKKFTDVLRNIQAGLEGIGGEEKTNILRNLVGKDFFAVLSAAIDGIEKIDRVSAIASDSIGELSDKARRQNETLSASIRGVASAFQEVLIEANDTRVGLKTFFDTLANSIRLFGGATVETEKLTTGVQQLATALSVISWSAVAGGVYAVGVALASINPVVTALAVSFGVIVAASRDIALSLEGTSEAALNAIKGFNKYAEQIEQVTDSLEKMRQASRNAMDLGQMDKYKAIGEDIKDTYRSALETIATAGEDASKSVVAALRAVGEFRSLTGDEGLDLRLTSNVDDSRRLATAAEQVELMRALANTAGGYTNEQVRQLQNNKKLLESLLGIEIEATVYKEQVEEANKALKEQLGVLSETVMAAVRKDNLAKQEVERQKLIKAEREKEASILSKNTLEAQKALAVAKASALVKKAEAEVDRASLAASGERLFAQVNLKRAILERLKLTKDISEEDKKTIAVLAQIAGLEASLFAEERRSLALAKEKKQEESDAEALKRAQVRAEKEAKRAAEETLKVLQAKVEAESKISRDIAELRTEERLSRTGRDATLETSPEQFANRLNEIITSLEADNVDTETARRLALEKVELERQIIINNRKYAESQDRLSESTADVQRAMERMADQADRLAELRLRASGDEEGALRVRAEAAARDLPEGQREEFIARELEIDELQKQIQRENQIRNSLANALGSFVSTLIQNGGDVKEALGTLAQNLAQAFANQAVQSLASGISGSLFGGGVGAPQQVGGIIPAQVGQIINSPTVVSRGGRNYSISEGGGSTPEAVMPLMRDGRGRLGVAGTGGGSTNITMNFPNVQTTQEARNMRSTMRQQIRGAMQGGPKSKRSARNK